MVLLLEHNDVTHKCSIKFVQSQAVTIRDVAANDVLAQARVWCCVCLPFMPWGGHFCRSGFAQRSHQWDHCIAQGMSTVRRYMMPSLIRNSPMASYEVTSLAQHGHGVARTLVAGQTDRHKLPWQWLQKEWPTNTWNEHGFELHTSYYLYTSVHGAGPMQIANDRGLVYM